MPESWTISVGGRVYGPYSFEQMQAFHAEGRLADHSLVARAGEEQFHAAGEDAALAALFPAAVSPASAAPVEPLHVEEAAADPVAAAPHRFGRSEPERTSGQPSHFVIISDMKSRSITGLEEEIFNLGPAYRFMPQAWVLTSEASLNTIRNALVQKLGKIDTLFIVDATHDKAAWFNFGPEAIPACAGCGAAPPRGPAGTERRASRRPSLSESAVGKAPHIGDIDCAPTGCKPAICSGVKRAHRPRRLAQYHLAVLERLAFGHQRAGAHQRVVADARAVEQDRAHADQRIVAHQSPNA